MTTTSNEPTKLMTRIKNIVEVTLPLLRDLRRELGVDKANALVYASLRKSNEKWVQSLAPSDVDDPLELWRITSEVLDTYFEGDVIYKVEREDESGLHLNVSFCQYAEYFRSIGEPELGAILSCELDDHIARLGTPAVEFSRHETIMMGANACPFRYKFKGDIPST